MKKLILLSLLCSLLVQAEEPGVQIQIIDPDIDSSSLEEKYKVTREADTYSALPNKEMRDETISSVSAAKEWDELQKDIFYMDLQSKSVEELAAKYPELKKEDLTKLKGNK